MAPSLAKCPLRHDLRPPRTLVTHSDLRPATPRRIIHLMVKYRVYVDTSVIGGCEDVEFSAASAAFFDQVRRGRYVALVSEVTYFELQRAPETVRRVLDGLPEACVEEVPIDAEVDALAQAYIDAGALSSSRRADATHVAAATVARADLILSWNFQHIVNFNRIHKFKGVNLQNGYPPVEIYSPMELRYDDQE